MGASIAWRDSIGMQGTVDVGFQEIFVGRAVECAIRTDDPMVSRRHARIYVQDGRHVIEDLGSANGMFVGDVRTQMHALSNGDSVRCGNLTMSYQTDGVIASPGMGGGMGAFGGAATAMAPGLGMGPPSGFGPPPGGGFGGGPPAGGGFGGVPQGGFGGGPPPPMGGGGFGGPPPPMGGGGFGGPPPAMGGGGFGGPPPAYGGGAPAAMPSMGAPPPPSSGPSIPDYSQAEFQRMQRRIDQLQSEVRLVRGGGEQALRMEELENKVSRLDRDNQELVQKNMVLQAKLASGGGGGPMRLNTQALVLSRSEEVVNGLNDVLSELRINILAAEGEVENWAHTLPKASFELVRESLRSCRAQMESAKDLMRLLREQR